MRKRIIAPVQQEAASLDHDWLNVEGLAEVEITSEDAAHPIELALLPGQVSGWRAAGPGKQTIRLFLVAGWRAVVPGNSAAAVEFQSPRRNLRDGRSSCRAPGGHCARVDHQSGQKWRNRYCFFGAVAARLTG